MGTKCFGGMQQRRHELECLHSTMNRIRATIHVSYVNVPVEFDRALLQDTFEFIVTRNHVWRDIAHLLWTRSPQQCLKPVFINLVHNGRRVQGEDKVGTLSPPYENLLQLNVVADLSLVHSGSIPLRTPVEHLFDISIVFQGKPVHYRETIHTTASALREHITVRDTSLTQDDIRLYWVFENSYTPILDMEGVSLGQVLNLDAPPLHEVTFLACVKPPHTPLTIYMRCQEGEYHVDLEVDRFGSSQELRDTLVRKLSVSDVQLQYNGQSVPITNGPMYDIFLFRTDYVVFTLLTAGALRGQVCSAPTPTIPESDAAVSHAKKALQGETFEVVASSICSSESTKQDDFSSTDYVISADISGDEGGSKREVILNSFQCMVVDNGFHAPYLLVNRAGMAKLRRVFRKNDQPLLEEITVTRQSPNAIQDLLTTTHTLHASVNGAGQDATDEMRVRRRVGPPVYRVLLIYIVNNYEVILSWILRALFIIYLLDLHNLVLDNYTLLFSRYTWALGLLWVMFFSGERVANWLERTLLGPDVDVDRRVDTMIISKIVAILRFSNGFFGFLGRFASAIKAELISVAVSRRRDFEYEVIREEGRDNWWLWMVDVWTNLYKDVLLLALAFLPSSYSIIRQKLEDWRSGETADLKIAFNTKRQLVAMLITRYQEKYPGGSLEGRDPLQIVDSQLVEASSNNLQETESLSPEEEAERNYQSLLARFMKLRYIEKLFVKVLRTGLHPFATPEVNDNT